MCTVGSNSSMFPLAGPAPHGGGDTLGDMTDHGRKSER